MWLHKTNQTWNYYSCSSLFHWQERICQRTLSVLTKSIICQKENFRVAVSYPRELQIFNTWWSPTKTPLCNSIKSMKRDIWIFVLKLYFLIPCVLYESLKSDWNFKRTVLMMSFNNFKQKQTMDHTKSENFWKVRKQSRGERGNYRMGGNICSLEIR